MNLHEEYWYWILFSSEYTSVVIIRYKHIHIHIHLQTMECQPILLVSSISPNHVHFPRRGLGMAPSRAATCPVSPTWSWRPCPLAPQHGSDPWEILSVGFWRVNPWAILRLLGCQKDRLLIDDWYNHIYQTPSYNMVIFHSYVNVYQRVYIYIYLVDWYNHIHQTPIQHGDFLSSSLCKRLPEGKSTNKSINNQT